MQELIELLQREMNEGATVTSCTIVIKKDYVPYVITYSYLSDDVYIDEI